MGEKEEKMWYEWRCTASQARWCLDPLSRDGAEASIPRHAMSFGRHSIMIHHLCA